jgi:hypothetical protein
MADGKQLSRGGAVAIGLACAGMGVFVMLMAFGVIGRGSLDDAPPWVGVCAGLVFVLGGAAVIVGYAIADGAAPDGDLPPGTPFGIRLAQYLLGLGIVASLASIATWVAFGEGPRKFTGSGSLGTGPVGDTAGRIVFGVGAVLVWGFLLLLGIVGAKRLRRP